MKLLHFSSLIEIREGNPYILVERLLAEQVKTGWKRPMPVIITVNGEPKDGWHINMMPVGNGDFYLYLHGDVREASHTKVGDRVDVTVSFDEAYKNGPQHPMPVWFSDALKLSPVAQQNWDNLSPSRQKEILRYFSWLKSDEAKQRNLEKALLILSGKPGRFMARDWNGGK